HGRERTRQYLREITFSEQWLLDATPTEVINLLDRIELAGHLDLVCTFAFEGVERSTVEAATAGFAGWLEVQGDDAALSASDRYYDRLRDTIARRTPLNREWQLTLWPARDSAATDALRREVLKDRYLAWFVIRTAIRRHDYREAARPVWLAIVREDPDRSRRRGLVYQIVRDPAETLSTSLLLDTLGVEAADRWTGDDTVQWLCARGHREEVRQRLVAAFNDPSLSASHRTDLERLLQLAELPLAEGV